MHGVKRVDKSQEPVPKTEAELYLIQEYSDLCHQFQALHATEHNAEWANQALELTKRLLLINPEYYTAWNERKRAIELLARKPSKDALSSTKEELEFSVQCIKSNPKSYSSWHHRKWVLGLFCGNANAKALLVPAELKLLEKLLEADSRNFHGWNYRIWLAEWAGLSVIEEFDFTTLKIYQNFSNYSAWQRRSHLLPMYLKELSHENRGIESILRNEVEMCRNAAWTEPADQSVWFYQRWLFGHLPHHLPHLEGLLNNLAGDQLNSVMELIEGEESDSSVALAMSFVVYLLRRVDSKDDRIRVFLEKLIHSDPLRRAHYQEQLQEFNRQSK